MPEWISKATCLRCKKKGHLAFNFPTKYSYKIIKANTDKNNMGFKLTANNVKDCVDEKLGITEFAGMAYTSRQHTIKSPCYIMNNKDYHHHKKKITNICHTRRTYKRQVKFNHLLHNKSRYNGLEHTIIAEIKKLSYYNKISILWLLCSLDKQKSSHSPIAHKSSRIEDTSYSQVGRHSQIPHFHRRKRCKTSAARRSTYAYSVEHELLAKNHFPASDLEKDG